MYRKWIGRALVGTLLVSMLTAGCGNKEENYYGKAQDYMKMGQYGLALENYNKAIMEDEKLQQSYRGAGIASMKLADYERAEDLFLRALKESDGVLGDVELDLSYYLGEAQVNLGKYEEAVETYSNLLKVYDQETDAFFYRGCAYLKGGDVDKAKTDFEKAAKDKDAMTLLGIYEAYASVGSEEGYPYLEQIISLEGKDGEELYAIGKAYGNMGDVQQALSYLKQAKEAGEMQALFQMGVIQAQLGDYDAAMECYNEYKNTKGLTYGEYSVVQQCMLTNGDVDGALELNQYMKKSAGKTDMMNLYFDEIVIYEQSHDYSSAKAKAEEYVAMYPDDERGQKEYEFLLTR